jgi:hypothetical protein
MAAEANVRLFTRKTNAEQLLGLQYFASKTLIINILHSSPGSPPRKPNETKILLKRSDFFLIQIA